MPKRLSSASISAVTSSSVDDWAGQLDTQAAVARHGDLGPHLQRGVERHRSLFAPTGDLDLRRVDDVDLVLAHGLGEVLRDGVVERLFAGGGDADAGLEHAARRLAGTETGEAHLLGDLAERPVDVAIELALVDGDRQLDLVALDLLQRRIHRDLRLTGRRGARRLACGVGDSRQAWPPRPGRRRYPGRVGVKSMGQRLRASVNDLERARLMDRCSGLGITNLDEVVPRQPIRVGGEIHRVVIAPRHGVPTLEVVVSDGTGSVTAVFTGRRKIIGVEHGRTVILEGVAVPEQDRLVIFNPAYTLVAPPTPLITRELTLGEADTVVERRGPRRVALSANNAPSKSADETSGNDTSPAQSGAAGSGRSTSPAAMSPAATSDPSSTG